jgi:hypothetical protein
VEEGCGDEAEEGFGCHGVVVCEVGLVWWVVGGLLLQVSIVVSPCENVLGGSLLDCA